MRQISWIVGLFLITACGSTKNKDNQGGTKIVNPTRVTTDRNDEIKVRPLYQATRTVFTDLIHTKLEVSFDWSKSWMYGKATITAKPHFYASDSLFLDAKGMEIKSVSIGNQALKYTYNGAMLRIGLNKTYTKSEKYDIVIQYIAKPDERATSGSAAITSDKGLYFINPKGEDKNKMPQIWTQGETEANSVWFPTCDSPNMKSTQEILITVDEKYTTLSNGKLVSSSKNLDGTRTDHWKQDLPHSVYLFMMGIGEFKVVKDTYKRPDGTTMEVNYYVEPEWEQYAKSIFGETPAMIKFFSELTGVEYPWDKYNQIVVREYVSGAMENTGAVVFGDYVYKTDRDLLDSDDHSVIAHELFHHWFGNLVTAESWSNLTLNESFANYSQYLWDEYRYGLDVADYNAIQDAEGYFQSPEQHDLVWFDYTDKEQMFDAHTYNKGGKILHMLRNYMGDEAFFTGLRNYLTTNQFKAAEFNQLRIAFEEVCGEDLNWFFNQWYLGKGYPVLKVEQSLSDKKNEVILKVSQQQDLTSFPLFKLPVEVGVYDGSGMHVHKIVIDQTENTFRLPVSGTLKTVVFDHQHMLLARVNHDKPVAQSVEQFYLGKRYADRMEGFQATLEKDSTSVTAQQLITAALNDPFWDVRLEGIYALGFLKGEYKSKAVEKVKTMVSADENPEVRAMCLTALFEEMKPETYEQLLKQTLAKEQSYQVLGVALAAYAGVNPVAAMAVAKSMEKDASPKMKVGIAQAYAKQGGASEFPFFKDLLGSNKVGGYNAIYALNALTVYIARQSPEIQMEAVSLYQTQYQIGGPYAKMFMMQFTNYFMKAVSDQSEQTKAEITAHQKNNSNGQVEVLKQKLTQQKLILTELDKFQKEIKIEKHP